ncbi:MAG: hypothetical protein ACOVRN_18995 [Flavobacterium sp.]
MKSFFVAALLLVSTVVFAHCFIAVDKDTYELVDNVNYTLFSNKKPVYNAVTLPDKLNTIHKDIVFDSIALSRVDYETFGAARKNMDSVFYLTKKIFYLDEVVIGSDNKKQIVLGETNRFIKRRSSAISDELIYGLMFRNGTPQDYVLDKFAFYVEKVKVKTAYKVNFISVDEDVRQENFHLLNPGKVIYATDTLYLNPKDKNKIELALPKDFYLPSTKKMFVWVQLLGYYDEKGSSIVPEKYDDLTKIKFQLSDKTDYYSRMSDGGRTLPDGSHPLTDFIVNMNVMLNHDYLAQFFITPPKSALVAPDMVLYAHKPDSKPMNVVKKID